MSSGLIRFFVAGVFALAAAVAPHAGVAQQAPATSPSAPTPAAPTPTTPDPPPAATPAPAAPGAAPPAESTPSGEGSTGEAVDLPPRPFAYIEGKTHKDAIYSSILGSLSLVKR